ncbi:hypothetical protein V2J09_006781 [Rumex salicifolius]
MTLKSGTSQACAACKYQRRKCTSDCQLAPYFPPDKPKIFLHAHKLFGVSNILKILKQLDPSLKPEAMSSIIYESNVRAKFPELGCVAVMQHYMHQIRHCQEEITRVRSLIELAQSQAQAQQPQIQPNSLDDQLQLGMAPNPAHVGPFINPRVNSKNFSYSSCSSNTAYVESNDNKASVVAATDPPFWIQQAINNERYDDNSPEIKTLIPSEEVIIEYDDIKPFFDTNIFDKQSYVASKKAYDSSPESSMTDTMQPIECIEENELKTAAAFFTLTRSASYRKLSTQKAGKKLTVENG